MWWRSGTKRAAVGNAGTLVSSDMHELIYYPAFNFLTDHSAGSLGFYPERGRGRMPVASRLARLS